MQFPTQLQHTGNHRDGGYEFIGKNNSICPRWPLAPVAARSARSPPPTAAAMCWLRSVTTLLLTCRAAVSNFCGAQPSALSVSGNLSAFPPNSRRQQGSQESLSIKSTASMVPFSSMQEPTCWSREQIELADMKRHDHSHGSSKTTQRCQSTRSSEQCYKTEH